MIEYALTNLLYAVVGGLVGFFIGRLVVAAVQPVPPLAQDEVLPVGNGKLMSAQRITGAVLILLALASVIIGSISNVRLNAQTDRLSRITECQSAYNRAYAAGLQERVDASARDREAQRRLLLSLQNPAADRASEVRQFLEQGRLADVQRAASPLPFEQCR